MQWGLSFWGDERDRLAGLAALLRERARLRTPPYSTGRIIARCFPGVLVTGDRLWNGTLGLTRVTGAQVLIAYRRGLGDSRIREVIGHELGHLVDERLVAGDERRCTVGGAKNKRGIDFTLEPTRETRCDFFGDELLVPLIRLREDVAGARLFPPRREAEAWTVWHNLADWLSGRYRVTQACILRRLRLLADTPARRRSELAPVVVRPGPGVVARERGSRPPVR